jgi:hypothetical protein
MREIAFLLTRLRSLAEIAAWVSHQFHRYRETSIVLSLTVLLRLRFRDDFDDFTRHRMY